MNVDSILDSLHRAKFDYASTIARLEERAKAAETNLEFADQELAKYITQLGEAEQRIAELERRLEEARDVLRAVERIDGEGDIKMCANCLAVAEPGNDWHWRGCKLAAVLQEEGER